MSIKANINLVKRNAIIGSELAVHLASLIKPTSPAFLNLYTTSNQQTQTTIPQSQGKGKVIVLGGSAVDFEVKVADGKFELYQSCKGIWRTCYGGVGRNIA